MNSTLLRWTLVGGLVFGGLAVAQPVNDTCAGAEVLSPTTPGVPVVSSAVDITNAALTSEVGFSCNSSNSRSVWFTITPTATASYRIETCTGTAPLDTVSDTVIAVYGGSCPTPTQLTGACDDDGCSLRSTVTVSLTAGTTYYVQAAKYGTTAPSAGSNSIQVSATLVLPHPNDQCSATSAQLLLNTPLRVTSQPPDAGYTAATNDAQLPNDGGCYQGIGNTVSTAAGRDTAYQFRADTTGSYSFRLSGAASSTPNHVLYLTNSCLPVTSGPVTYDAPVCRAAANRVSGSTTASEEAWCVPLTANETAYVWFDETAVSTSGNSATLEVTACTAELEPNGTPAQASALACPATGRIVPAGDVDYFTLGSPGVGARVFALVDSTSANAGDYRLRVTTDTDTLEYDDDDADSAFGSTAPSLAGTPLVGGAAYLQVIYLNTTTQSEPYRLYSVVQPGAATAELEPNDDAGVAFAGPSNYFSGTASATSDVDFYAFEANAGDLVFLSLDSQPARTVGVTSVSNFSLQLWDGAGSVLSVNDANSSADNTLTVGNLLATTPRGPSEGLWYRIRTSGTYYARVAASTVAAGGAYLLSISRNCTTGGGIGAPSLTGLTPTTGTTAGGTALTLTGSSFALGATVRVGGATATVVTRDSTRIVVTLPAGNEGAVDVSVVNPGNQVSTLTNGFTYVAPVVPPTITSLTPVSGSTVGGTVVTVNGTNFKANAEVTFTVGSDARQGTNVTIVNSTRLLVTTPAHLAGAADLTVRNVVDDLSGSLGAAFTFVAPPSVSTITPDTGFTTGGQIITLSGSNFRTGATVRFGTKVATGVTIASDGLSLTATLPSSTTNTAVDVSVTNPDTQVATVAGGFTYVFPAPTIASITPVQGFLDGGLTLTINGANFLAPIALADGGVSGPAVTLDGLAASNVTRTSATRVTAVTPAHGPGAVDLTLTNTDGQQVTLAAAFRYVAPPTVTAITPVRGPVQGGTRITVTGTDFLPGAVVRVGGVPAFGLSVVSATEITAVTSAASPGLAAVSVTNPDTQSAVLPDAFTFDPAPSLVSLSPIVGSTAGGTVVTLTGSDFRSGATVLFGTAAGTAVTVTSPTELTTVSPAHATGVVSVTVRNDDGQDATLARAYRFVAPPTLTSATPNTGAVTGGTVVRLVGTGFGAQMTVTFGADAASSVALISATEVDVVTPPHAPGAVDVVLTTSTGVSATLTGGFTYARAAPTVSGIAPGTGPEAGGTLVTLTGAGFAPGATVKFDGVEATGVELGSSSLLRAIAPAHAEGAVNVLVTNDDGQSATLVGGFTYVALPGGQTGLVTDGGTGGLGSLDTDAGTGGGNGGGGGCGCASVDASTLGVLGLGLVTLLRRRRR